MTGYRAFSPLFVKTYPVLSRGFEIETEMTIHALDKNFQIETIPVAYRDRPEGSSSKLNTCSDGMRVLRTLVRLFRNYRPLSFFGGLGAVLMVLSVAEFIPVLMEYWNTHLVERFPTLIVCGFCALTALLLWSCGLILETVIQKQRQQFELQLNVVRLLLEQRGITVCSAEMEREEVTDGVR